MSFTGEKLAVDKYNELMIQSYKSGVQEGLATGFGFGLVMCIMYSTYALAMWYGGKMVVEKGYTGGDIVNIIFAVLTGSMYATATPLRQLRSPSIAWSLLVIVVLF